MKRIFTIVYAALCLLMVACGVGRTPKSTIKAFFSAIEQGEYIEALQLTSLRGVLSCALAAKECKSLAENGGLADMEIISVEPSMEDENRATATVMITYGNGSSHEEFCQMLKVENKWKIDVNLNSK